ncbi:hypothetical protein KIN20_012743 [Parelaphostrongylus tenuis]|uniref:Uncharacterized protein n=1 Tax=Parelaphostrongylus tenuis TaxID=148309 RepID=A0AAD5N1C9_PARTN|nr:hypothetical protein KIN20_012743 [Parelaphostrongylus tenuis]
MLQYNSSVLSNVTNVLNRFTSIRNRYLITPFVILTVIRPVVTTYSPSADAVRRTQWGMETLCPKKQAPSKNLLNGK